MISSFLTLAVSLAAGTLAGWLLGNAGVGLMAAAAAWLVRELVWEALPGFLMGVLDALDFADASDVDARRDAALREGEHDGREE